MAVQFIRNGNTVTLTRAYSYPVDWPRRRIQASQELAAGTLRVQDFGTEVATVTLQWDRMEKADRDALLAFWRQHAAGAKNSFTFVDHAGASHTVRWTNDWNEGEVGYQIYRVTIVLREEIAG